MADRKTELPAKGDSRDSQVIHNHATRRNRGGYP